MSEKIQPISQSSIIECARHIIIRDLKLDAEIGVWDHERGRTQPIIINLELAMYPPVAHHSDKLDGVVCYDQIVQKISTLVGEGHIQLIETLAEKIADTILLDPRLQAAKVRVEKPQALDTAESVGIEIERRKDM